MRSRARISDGEDAARGQVDLEGPASAHDVGESKVLSVMERGGRENVIVLGQYDLNGPFVAFM